MKPLEDMLASLERALEGDAARRENAATVREKASRVGARFPLVHRTCKPEETGSAATGEGGGERSWLEILRRRTFAARKPCTPREEAAGIQRAAYFFLGCGAYPDGLVGFVLDAPSILSKPSSFTPFDTGSLDKWSTPRDPALASSWDESAKYRFFESHLGRGEGAAGFAGPYLAAHFRDPVDYLRRAQISVPEFDAYHGLTSTTGDRRAWTIELQVHEDVPLDSGKIDEVVVGRQALLLDFPADLIPLVRVTDAENEVLESIAAGIVSRIQAEEG